MGLAAPLVADQVVFYTNLVILLTTLVVQIIAFVHCLTQRADGFVAVGTLPKGAWLAILLGSILLNLLLWTTSVVGFSILVLSAALVYLLDVRPALHDAVDGTGSW
jgi:uncharacterized protein DUF2516